MILIDRYAYSSKLKQTAPLLKLLFALITQGICLWADNIIISIMIILMMGAITVIRGRTPLSTFIKMLLIPIAFIAVSVFTIAVSMSEQASGFLFAAPILGKWVGVSYVGIQHGLQLFLKAFGAMSCLVFLSLSTPMVDLLVAFRQLGLPKFLIEIMGLVYRFIFVLLDTSNQIFVAQSCRLGYSGLRNGYRSLGTMASMVFIRAYKRSDDLYTALEARGYDGELKILEEPYHTHWSGYVFAASTNILLVISAIILK